ncbi:MAG: HAMP domain-containing protein [Calditrichaeota bacterium]|nr:HAMP domain-containing protein [Calditrichota bacterium]MCB9367829.1 HAMP domain-containing protein [Calditrichota bacterium]
MLKSPLFLRATLWTLVAGAVLTAVSLFVFQRVVTSRVRGTVGDELMTSQRVVRQLLDQQEEFLHAVAINQAEYISMMDMHESPDSATHWGKHYLDMAMLDLLQIEDSTGHVVTSVIRGEETPSDSELFKLMGLRFQYDDMYLYQIASAELPDHSGKRVYVGKRLDTRWLWGLSEITRSRMAVYTGNKFLFVSVDSTLINPIGSSMPWDMSAMMHPLEMKIADQDMLVMCEGLPDGPSPDLCVLLVRDLEPELAILKDIKLSVGVLAGVILLLMTVIAGFGVAKLVGRVRALNSAAAALERGEADTVLLGGGHDEIGSLTKRFGAMREKLHERQKQLEFLNKRLSEQMKELRQTQRQLIQSEKLSTVGRLSAQLSHELNNPICNIQNCVEVLGRPTIAKDEAQEYVHLIRDEVGRMAKLTRQLLDFHRPAKEEFRQMNLNAVVESVLKVSTPQLDSKGVKSILELDSSLPAMWGDADQIKQVLLNLILNSVDAMPGGGTITVRTHAEEEQVVMEVSDTGIGMDEATRDKIFDAFFTTKSEVAGVGLGLFVCYKIIRLHGGFVDVNSVPGEGSTFSVKLPLKPAHISVEEGELV